MLITINCIITLCPTIFAHNGDIGFSYGAVSKEVKETFINNINISLVSKLDSKEKICCFDINESGSIAIGTGKYFDKYVWIYSDKGDFQYGYKFNCSGSYGVEWNSDNIKIHFVRSDITIELNRYGDVINIYKIEKNPQNNYHWNNVVFSSKKQQGENIYIAKDNNPLATSYSKLIKIDAKGYETTVYDIEPIQNVRYIISFLFLCVFLIIVFYTIKKQLLKNNQTND